MKLELITEHGVFRSNDAGKIIGVKVIAEDGKGLDLHISDRTKGQLRVTVYRRNRLMDRWTLKETVQA
jgi:hypothetical protein